MYIQYNYYSLVVGRIEVCRIVIESLYFASQTYLYLHACKLTYKLLLYHWALANERNNTILYEDSCHGIFREEKRSGYVKDFGILLVGTCWYTAVLNVCIPIDMFSENPYDLFGSFFSLYLSHFLCTGIIHIRIL